MPRNRKRSRNTSDLKCEEFQTDLDKLNNNKLEIDVSDKIILDQDSDLAECKTNDVIVISSDDETSACDSKRIKLVSSKRRSKIKNGFSRFERKNDTRNLDKFFLQLLPCSRKKSSRNYQKVDENISFACGKSSDNFSKTFDKNEIIPNETGAHDTSDNETCEIINEIEQELEIVKEIKLSLTQEAQNTIALKCLLHLAFLESLDLWQHQGCPIDLKHLTFSQ